MSSDIISQAGRQSYGSLGYFYINSRVCCFKSALLTLMLLFSGNSLGNSLPAISPGASAGMSVADEYRLGRIIAGSIHRQLPLWQDLPTLSLLTDIAQPLISSSQLSNKNLQLFIVHDDRINAFAAPGGIIGINTGLINQAGSVDELAAVIAHEVAHLSLRHYVQTQAQEKVQAPLFVGALLASIWLASNVDGDLGEASMHATQSALQRSQLSYSRAHERQADRVGFELMLQSPFNVAHMQSLLQRLQSPYATDSAQWEWARSHPINSERVADISQRTLSLSKSRTDHGFDLGFNLLRIYLKISLNTNVLPSIAELMAGSDALSANYGTLMNYAKALRNQRQGKLALTSSQLGEIHKNHPQVQLIWYNWMQSLLALKQSTQVLQHLQERKQQRHEDKLSVWLTALALRANNQPQAAVNSLWRLLQLQPNWLHGWLTLGEWSVQDQRFQLHHIAQSQWHLLRGEAQLALRQAEYALLQQADPLIPVPELQKRKALQLRRDENEFN